MSKSSKLIRFKIIIVIFTTIHQFLCAQQPIYKNFNVSHGLPSMEVYSILQDSKGYLWFCSDRGITRYNGYEFQNYSLKDGLNGNTIFAIHEDNYGKIWFGSMNSKLSYFDNGKIKKPVIDNSDGYSIGMIHKISSGKGDTLWLITSSGLYFLNKLKTYNHYEMGQIHESGLIRINMQNMIFFNSDYHKKDKTVNYKGKILAFPEKYEIHSPSKRLARISDSKYLFAFDNDLWLVSESGLELIKSFDKKIIYIGTDIDDRIWIGLYQGGVYFYSDAKEIPSKSTNLLPITSVSSVLVDSDKGIWISTLENGIYYIKNTSFSCFPSFNTNVISGYKNENIFFADNQGQLNIFKNKKLTTLSFHEFTNIIPYGTGEINDICVNDSGIVVLAHSNKGLIFINKENKEAKASTYYSTSLSIPKRVHYSDTNFIINTNGSIQTWHPVTDKLDVNNIKTETTIRSSLVMGDSIWLGCLDGLYIYYNSRAHRYRPDVNIFSNRVEDIQKINDEQICIATRGAGLIINQGKQFLVIDEKKGLISNMINRIFVDEHYNIWIATNKGISRVEIIDFDDKKIDISNITTSHGLISNLVKDVYVYDHNVWVATYKGICTFNSLTYKNNITNPKLHIVEAKIGSYPYLPNERMELTYCENTIKASFFAVSIGTTSKIEYKYTLSGFENKWHYSYNRELIYTNLPPGKFDLKISARNSNGNWLSPTIISFIIHPAFWNTWWFRFLIITATVSIIFFLFKYRILNYNGPLIKQILSELLRKLKKERFIFIKEAGGIITKIDVDRILYFKASREYVEVITDHKKYLVHSSFKKFIEQLPNVKYFVRTHRSYVVRISSIEIIGSNFITINGQKLPISKTYKSEIEKIKAKNISLVND